jgi:hypothetical protein
MTTLNASLSPSLQSQLSHPGVWAYAVYFDSNGNNPTWTSLVSNGTVQGSTVPIALPDPLVGGKIYFIVQSQNQSQPFDLQTLITMQSELNWGNAGTYDFRYDSFEVTLQNSPFDSGNLSSVNGFGLPMAVSIAYQNGTTSSVGYAINGSTLVGDINAINPSNTYASNYTSGPLQNQFRMALSPTESLAQGPTGPFRTSDWQSYVASVAAGLSGPSPTRIVLSGEFNGAPDASHVWHNGGYFAYQLRWDGTFWLDPLPSSQVRGRIQITAADLENSIYSTLGSANIYTDQGVPYLMGMNTGANNQWGKVLSELLTGFTGGFYLNSGTSPNSQVAGAIDLNRNSNWGPSYAFSPMTPPVNYQTSDPYSQIFYFHSNSYGSGYSDALMSQYAVGGPLISVYDPVLQTNVQNINLTIYSDAETPQGYTQPAIYNYIAPGPNGYAVPNPADNGTNITLNFASAAAENAGVVPSSTGVITLNILTADAGGTPTWSTVTFNGSTAGAFGLWQNWNINYDSSHNTYSAVPFSSPVAQPAGTMLINQFPVADGTNSVSWYQIGVGDKTFNLYTTTNSGQFENTNYAGQRGALAIDGLATVTPQQSTAPTVTTFSVNFSVGDTVTYDPSLLVPNTTNVNVHSFPITPDAPVAGITSSGVFTALPNQTSPVTNTITTANADISFGWTGGNNDPSTASWIAHYTNKVDAGTVALVTIKSFDGRTSFSTPATADIDGSWQTNPVHLDANTAYTVTMTEYLPGDTQFTTPLSPASNPLILTITTPPPPPQATADMVLRHDGDGLYEIYDIGNNSLLAAYQLGQVGTDWQFVVLGGFYGGDTTDMLLRNSNTGGFEVYDVSNNNITGAAFLGNVGLDWRVTGFGNFSSFGETDMMLRRSTDGGLEVYDIKNNQIIGANFMGTAGLNWQFSGVGNFSSRGTSDMLLRDADNGGLEVYDIDSNQITGAAFIGTIGVDWQFSGVGNFSGVPGETDLLLRNSNTGGLEVYDISSNQLTGAAFIGAVGLDWQYAGVAAIHGPGASDLVLRNVNTGAFEVYDIEGNTLVGAASLGAVGLDWRLGGFAPTSGTGPPGSSGDSTAQLVQAIAGFGGAAGAADGMTSAFGADALQQQQFLTTPQHA